MTQEVIHSKQREVFAENLRSLIDEQRKERGETLKAFAERVDVPYGWLRRVSTQGVRYTGKRSVQNLEKLAFILGLNNVKDFWKLPEQVAVEEVIRLMKTIHPRQWALAIAWEGQFGDGEERVSEKARQLAESGIPRTHEQEVRYRHWGLPLRNTARQVADYMARVIDESFVVISRKQHPEIWEQYKESKKRELGPKMEVQNHGLRDGEIDVTFFEASLRYPEIRFG